MYIHLHKYTMNAFSTAAELYYLSCILSQIHYKRNINAVAIWIKILLGARWCVLYVCILYPHGIIFIFCMHALRLFLSKFIEIDPNVLFFLIFFRVIIKTDLTFCLFSRFEREMCHSLATNGSTHIISFSLACLIKNALYNNTNLILQRHLRVSTTPNALLSHFTFEKINIFCYFY